MDVFEDVFEEFLLLLPTAQTCIHSHYAKTLYKNIVCTGTLFTLGPNSVVFKRTLAPQGRKMFFSPVSKTT